MLLRAQQANCAASRLISISQGRQAGERHALPGRQRWQRSGARSGSLVLRAETSRRHSNGSTRRFTNSAKAQPAGQDSSGEGMTALPTQAPSAKATASSSTATLINVAVGAGVLSMPYAYSSVGWSLGLGLTVGVAAVEAATLCVLCHFAEQTGATSYAALVNKMLGPKASVALSVVLYFYLLLSCTAYLIISADCICPLLEWAFGPQGWWVAREAVVAAVGLGVLLPLSLPRTLGAVAGVSTFKVYAILFVVGAVVLRSASTLQAPDYPWAEVRALEWSQGLLAALPIFAFGFQCHTAVVDVWNELEDKPSFFPSTHASSTPSTTHSQGSSSSGSTGSSISSKQRGMIGVAAASIGAIACFYSVMGLFGYLAFPTGTVEGNIMNNFPKSDLLMQVARAMVGLIVIAAFPVNHIPARATLLDLLRQLNGGRELPGNSYTVELVGFCLVCTAVALHVSDLGAIFQLAGGTAASVLIFGIPGALLIKSSLQRHGEEGQRQPRRDALATRPLPADGSRAAGLQPQQQPQLVLLQQAQAQPSWWHSKVVWAGVALEVVTVASWGVTLYNLLVLQR